MSVGQGNLPPGPRSLREILEVIKLRKRDPIGLYLKLFQKYGDVIYFRVGSNQFCILSDPEAAQYVLQTHAKRYPKSSGLKRYSSFLGNGLLINEGESWRRQRRLVAPAFLRERLADYSRQMASIVQSSVIEWSERIRSESVIDVASEMNKFTLKVMGETLLGSDPSARASEVAEAAIYICRHVDAQLLSPFRILDFLMPFKDQPFSFWLSSILPSEANRVFNRELKKLDQIVYGIIQMRRQELNAGAPQRKDLLSILLTALDEDDKTGMTDQQLRDEVMTMFLAGHETTAISLAWTFYLLAKNPDQMAAVREELSRELAGKAPSFDDLPRLKKTLHAFEESLRLYPPFWRISRQATEDDQIQGYFIPKGTMVIASQYLIHRNPKIWENPDEYLPDRFEDSTARHRFSFIPFGAGARVCIGTNFAVLEAVLIIANLIQNFEFELVNPDKEPAHEAHITYRILGGLPMKVRAIRKEKCS